MPVHVLLGEVEDGPRPGRRQRQSAAARLLAVRLLDALAPGVWRIGSQPDGRPIAIAADGGGGPDLGLSHSGAWAAAAVASRGRIGIDIETPRPGRDVTALARALFTPAEQRAVAAGGEAAFLACWTLREAVAKAAGGGLALALALDGTALVGALGASAMVTVNGQAWAVAQRGAPRLQLALAWSGGSEAAVAAAGDCAWARIQAPT